MLPGFSWQKPSREEGRLIGNADMQELCSDVKEVVGSTLLICEQ